MNEKYKSKILLLHFNKQDRTVLYIGYIENLKRRLSQHNNGTATVFTKKYSVRDLPYFEVFDDKKSAKTRERRLKIWRKEWKWNLIKSENYKLETLSIN